MLSSALLNTKHIFRSSGVIGISSLVLLVGTSYLIYGVERANTPVLLGVYTLAFITYLGCYRLALTPQRIRQLLLVAIVARGVLLPAMPNLSDDLYRFVWDGRLLAQGYDPFLRICRRRSYREQTT